MPALPPIAVTAAAAFLLLCLVATPSRALTCDALKAEIDLKIRASGVANPTLTVVDAAASAPGKVVGSCDNGSRRIMYTGGASAAPVTLRAAPAGMLTECKPGFSGPNCVRDAAPAARPAASR